MPGSDRAGLCGGLGCWRPTLVSGDWREPVSDRVRRVVTKAQLDPSAPQHLMVATSLSQRVFLSGMILLVRGVENLGLTAAFGQGLLRLAGTSQVGAIALVAGGTALGANLINNVPMALVMISAVHGVHAGLPTRNGMVFAAILGADLGPNLTTVGSLATILWLLILRRKGLEVSTRDYRKLGLAVVPVMLALGVLLIWLRL